MSELLPCPFCGGKAQWNQGWSTVACEQCQNKTQRGAKRIMVDQWNTRTNDKAVEALRKIVVKAREDVSDDLWLAVEIADFAEQALKEMEE